MGTTIRFWRWPLARIPRGWQRRAWIGPCAFGVLAMGQGNPIDTAVYAAALSGDADTVGAIACAIAGAWQGIDAIPFEHIQTLRQANPQYDFEETAEALYEIAKNNYYASPPPANDDTFPSPTFFDAQ